MNSLGYVITICIVWLVQLLLSLKILELQSKSNQWKLAYSIGQIISIGISVLFIISLERIGQMLNIEIQHNETLLLSVGIPLIIVSLFVIAKRIDTNN